jgi:cobalt-zinc-cadmium efflux system membrane fusion protein
MLWAAGLAVMVGCQQERPRNVVEDAPFEVVEGKFLRVREDLIPNLRFATAEESDVAAEVSGLGHVTFAPGAAYALRVPFGGFVETVNVGVGQVVEENQVLATIRSAELAKMRADYQRMSAELTAQVDALKRAKTLLATGAGPERNVIALAATVGSLEAQRTGIRHALLAARTDENGDDLLELRAPRGGHVITRRLDPGELAEDPENIPAFVIADPTRLVVKANFPERDAPLLSVGFPCGATVPSLGETSLPAHVSAVVQAIDPESRTVEVVCTFDSLDSRLRAEMLARVKVSVKGPPRVLVPRSAVLLRRDSRVVLVRRGERELERRTIVVGVQLDSKLEVLSGVSAGEEVVVDGAVLLDGELDRLL